jgi:hypothetical protein
MGVFFMGNGPLLLSVPVHILTAMVAKARDNNPICPGPTNILYDVFIPPIDSILSGPTQIHISLRYTGGHGKLGSLIFWIDKGFVPNFYS